MKFVRPASVEEAVQVLASAPGRARVLAGGTDLVTLLADRGADVVVDVKRIPGLGDLVADHGGVTIGATVTMRDLEPLAGHRRLAAVVDGARVVGAPQTRRRATAVGNVCRASPAGDTLPALLTLSATATVVGTGGMRAIGLSEFFRSPGVTALADSELVTSLNIPAAGGAAAYQRLTYRTSLDLAVVGVAVAVEVADGIIVDARVGLGGVGPTPLLAHQTADVLVGTDTEDPDALADVLVEAGRVAAHECTPRDDVRGTAAYRTRAVSVLVGRVARTALARTDTHDVA
ncbi:FAD binding domain-containing protein [Nocardioides cavernae]|uniref:FAD binding domain-containing protein n=1 Tax=Nocardioides cavernae TaxID=1921566 RepID=A0ABR8N7Z3_9ACTN|nr:FAD binding domain-containing protein [Nocardioides cavernae]MBD3924263.1 FAD binding domain-containing protein [Nocardioides cavernae]MBM7510798.1 carbon-monoxide dehydrogenase medium subunit [Nocardioides cavernae]